MTRHNQDINNRDDISEDTKSFRGRINYAVRDYLEHLSLFSRNVRLYLTGSFFLGLTFSSYLLLLNLYFREQGVGEAFIGKVLSFGALGMTLASIPAAIILRRIRLKGILIFASVVYSGAIFSLTHLPISSNLVMLSFLGGAMMSFNRVAAGPFYYRNTGQKERTHVFSLSFGVMLLSSMIGSLLFGWMVSALSTYLADPIAAYRWTFLVSCLFGVAAIIPFGMIRAADPSEEDRGADLSWSLFKRQFPLYFRLFLPHFIVGTGAGLIIPFLNLYFRDRFEQPTDKIGIFYFAVNLTMLLGILAGPILVRKVGMIRSIVFTQLLSMPFMVILAFTYSLPLAVAAFLIRGALMNLGVPIGTNFGMEMVAKNEQALVNALLALSWNSSWMISTAVGGKLIESHSYELPLLIAVGLYLVSSVSYFYFFKNSEKKTSTGYVVEMSLT